MKNILNHFSLIALLGGALVFTACQKNTDETNPIDAESAEANAITDSEMSAIDEFVEDIINSEPQLNGRVAAPESLPSCATRTYDREKHTMTIDFGSENCECRDGKFRRGKIVSVFEGRPRQEGSKVTTTLVNYFVNDMQHTGVRTVVYVNHNKKNVVIRDASVITPEGTISWKAERVIERIAGGDTPRLVDDIYLISNRATGVNRKGVAYATTTAPDKPLKKVFAIGCARHFVSGILFIKNENGHTVKLNYDPTGEEPCDDIAEVTVNGHSKLIKLK
jgi:hypothetical protein